MCVDFAQIAACQDHSYRLLEKSAYGMPSSAFCSSLNCAARAQPTHDLEMALDPVGADLVWMRTFAAPGEHSVLVERVVELRSGSESSTGCAAGRGFLGHVLSANRCKSLKFLIPGRVCC